MQQGLPRVSVAGLQWTRDMLTEHLQSDYREVRLLLDRYNLTNRELQDVRDQLHELTGDSSDESEEEEEVGDDDYSDGDFYGGSAGPTEEVD
jgi:hypothetical protein